MSSDETLIDFLQGYTPRICKGKKIKNVFVCPQTALGRALA